MKPKPKVYIINKAAHDFSEDNSYVERILSFETVMEGLNGHS